MFLVGKIVFYKRDRAYTACSKYNTGVDEECAVCCDVTDIVSRKLDSASLVLV